MEAPVLIICCERIFFTVRLILFFKLGVICSKSSTLPKAPTATEIN